ncbi:hypothetical protein PR048_015330 [Dryococelus australis]|uniref:Sulfotransferase n=1 Tax=Dryococelus australis TaxID=614101 RepID=A0ABQ9HGN6_9NEOP|nr:hypothetical protein PR048_015330 [Dryococelus australis]
MASAIRKVTGFLGKEVSQQQVDKLASHLLIDTFRMNTAIRPNAQWLSSLINNQAQDFIHKGELSHVHHVSPFLAAL